MPYSLKNFLICIWILALLPLQAAADDAMCDRSEAVLADLQKQASGATALINRAAGVLVFPEVLKVGFGGSQEYGEGCLLVRTQPVAYYSTAGASYGLPLGSPPKVEVVLFMTPEALAAFRAKQAWEVGVDGEVALVRVADGRGIDSAVIGEPILGFIYTAEGLADGLTLDGARFTRLAR